MDRRNATLAFGTGGKEKGVDADAGRAVDLVMENGKSSCLVVDEETGQVEDWRKIGRRLEIVFRWKENMPV